MSLPHLIKHIYNNASDEVIRRGKRIHSFGHIEVIDKNPLLETVSFRVKDDMYNTWYKVKIENYHDPRSMTLRCTCPYNLTEVCRHKAAALLQLQEMSEQGALEGKPVTYQQQHTIVKIRHIDLKMMRMLAGNEQYEAAEEILRTHSASILKAENETVDAELILEGEKYRIRLRKNDERFFDTSCNCAQTSHVLCSHKTVVFLQLLNAYGANYFDSIRNYDRDKEKLLGLYGYTLQDDLTGKFEFTYKDGKPFLRVLDPTIKRVSINTQPPPPMVAKTNGEEIAKPTAEPATLKLGLVFRPLPNNYPYFTIEGVQAEAAEDGSLLGKVEKLDLTKYVETERLSEDDRQLLQLVRKMSDAEVNKYLNRNSPFSGIWENIVHTNGTELPEDTRALINEYLFPKLQRIADEQSQSKACYYLPAGKKFITENLQPLHLQDVRLKPALHIEPAQDAFLITCRLAAGHQHFNPADNEWPSPLAFLKEGELYTWQQPEDVAVMNRFAKPVMVPAPQWAAFAQKEMVPLTRDYEVIFDKSLITELRNVEPQMSLQLMERGEFLMFIPQFAYATTLAPEDEQPTITTFSNGRIHIVHRMLDKERSFLQKLTNLHTNFIRPERSRHLILKGTDVLRNNWFFLFMETMAEWGITVQGFEQLKQFKFNAARPSTRIRISSGVDWFDANVDIRFGDMEVRVADIKKALADKQSFVPLQDGTLGILPEEWIKKYSLLFKVGDGQQNNLRLNRFQFGVIDELYNLRDDEEIQIALEEKFERLRAFKRIRKVQPPKHLRKVLRPYQVTGFQWLHFLQEAGWGGILADDMGLGKTVQALAALEHFEDQHGTLKALVVCPTSLLYNWENEIKKFTPHLNYFIHHGAQRTRLADDLKDHHIIITTYGTLRSDIMVLSSLPFDYVVLDESQAIKNPHSKVAKAACLLQAQHRLCMSGTPLQNNTFDIFAQMNFLNPGLLGSTEYFRNEFATPIDKFGEQEQKEHLRKLLFPFILRRTKEQVAADLPEKTETVLYCEMGDEQRSIYNAYRNDYRDKVLGVIDSRGMERSQLTILQGLMKLRQICDSPAILNEEEKFPNHSIKLEELTREITENISDHKALVFSQFLGMLSLIKERLKQEGIEYEYFDGSTQIDDRQKAINNFQNNTNCRVFLISLKAGGVGLNLTAADYVYIVDPWWNPAVEQQAIDRTHRIGQTRNIFAYRMICKDTVEDKIIQLQEKKRLLAKELVSDDAGFVKKLTRDDIEYLFS